MNTKYGRNTTAKSSRKQVIHLHFAVHKRESRNFSSKDDNRKLGVKRFTRLIYGDMLNRSIPCHEAHSAECFLRNVYIDN
jgi:hypothetical protein